MVTGEKKTRIGEAEVKDVDKAIFVDEDINKRDMICLYQGRRMSAAEVNTRSEGSHNDRYLINITRGVYVGGLDAHVGMHGKPLL